MSNCGSNPTYLCRYRCQVIIEYPFASIHVTPSLVGCCHGAIKAALGTICYAFPSGISCYERHDKHSETHPKENQPIAAEKQKLLVSTKAANFLKHLIYSESHFY